MGDALRKLSLVAAAAVALHAQPPDPSAQLEAAIHREVVAGDLPGAVQQYRAVLSQAGKNRAIAARALYQMAQCLEKLGERRQAHAAYTRVAAEFGDQAEFAAQARARLAGWTDALPGPRNLRFEEGEPGKLPPGWFVPSVEKGAANLAELRHKGCRSAACAVVQAPEGAPDAVGNLMQSFSAAAYRGKTVRLHAWLRLEGSGADDRAQMWLRVDRPNGQNGFFDNMDDRPVTSGLWTDCEIAAVIDDDAQFLEFGVTSIGKGRAWVDEVSLDVIPEAQVSAARRMIERLYTAGEGEISAFQYSGTSAIATVHADFTIAVEEFRVSGVDTFRDTWLRTDDGWRLKERTPLARHFTAPPVAPDLAEQVVAELKRSAAPVATLEPGHTVYDLAPFGDAVRSARVVALGDSTGGSREVLQLKQRLTEYLAAKGGAEAVSFTNAVVNGRKPPGMSLREKWGDRIYTVAILTGDSLLASAGMPVFFLDLHCVAPGSALARWLGTPHLFLNEPEEQPEPAILSRSYDGIIFVELPGKR
ncbi:MAG TPA: hypothetical protein VGF59_14570 [Bryobacteraceae bacterium]